VPNLTSPSNNGFETTNDFYFTWTNSNDASPITYEFQSSLNPAQSGGVLTTGLWNSGTLPSNTIHSTGAPDGAWYWQVRAKDAAGNASAWSSVWKMTIDTTAPSAPGMPSTLPNPTNSTTQTWSWTAATDTLSGVANYAWRAVLGATTINDTTTTTSIITNLAEGIWNFFVKAIDNAGNESSESSGSVTVDTTAPVVAITSPTTTYVSGTVAINGTVTELNPDHYYLVIENSGGNIIAGPQIVYDKTSFTNKLLFTWDTTKVSDGKYTIDLEARDAADNKDSGSTTTLQVTVDNTAPATPSADPIAGNYTSDRLVTLTSTDSASGLANIFYTIEGSTPDNSSTPYTTPITVDKDMAIKAIAYDNAGNASDILEANYGIIISPMTMISLNLSNQGGPGDGLSDGLSSCPSCTQAPQGSLGGGGNVLGASITAAQGSALLASAPLLEQTVLGAATKSATPTPSINPSPTGKTLVSSSANWVLNHLMLSLLILLVLAGLGYYLYRKRKKKQNS
jgi:hypothetical protein